MKNLRKRLGTWIEQDAVQNTIIGLIVANAVVLGLQTSVFMEEHFEPYFEYFDTFVLYIFITELVLKLIVYDYRFFRSGWNVFDFVIIVMSLFPDSGALRILRSLRILRVLRLVRKLPRLRILIEAVLQSLPSLNWVSLLLVLIFYIWGIMGTMLFGEKFDDWFGTLGKSMYTLFQVMTLESWSMGISRPVMREFPYAWLYFITFIMLATYTSINIFIAIMVNTMQALAQSNEKINTTENEIIEPHAEDLLKIPKKEDEIIRLLQSTNARLDRLETALKELKKGT